jgi:hypothetical protein
MYYGRHETSAAQCTMLFWTGGSSHERRARPVRTRKPTRSWSNSGRGRVRRRRRSTSRSAARRSRKGWSCTKGRTDGRTRSRSSTPRNGRTWPRPPSQSVTQKVLPRKHGRGDAAASKECRPAARRPPRSSRCRGCRARAAPRRRDRRFRNALWRYRSRSGSIATVGPILNGAKRDSAGSRRHVRSHGELAGGAYSLGDRSVCRSTARARSWLPEAMEHVQWHHLPDPLG